MTLSLRYQTCRPPCSSRLAGITTESRPSRLCFATSKVREKRVKVVKLGLHQLLGRFGETPTADTKFLPALIDFSVSKSTAAKRICLLHVTPSLPAVVALALSLPTSQHPPLTCTVGSRSPLPITRWSATPCQPLYVFSQQIFLHNNVILVTWRRAYGVGFTKQTHKTHKTGGITPRGEPRGVLAPPHGRANEIEVP
jgi:hypothetical protein